MVSDTSMDNGRVGVADQALVASEEWRPIAGYEGLYAISDQGRVKSVRNGRLMSQVPDGTHYPTVKLYRAGVGTRFKVHRLVCAAFHGPSPFDGAQAAHLDGSRTNSRADNLKWVTRSENEAHKVAHGTALIGANASHHKRFHRLSDDEVTIIRAMRETGSKVRDLAQSFEVTEGHVYRILAGERR